MNITICRPDELGETEIALWRAWQKADARLANPFLAPEFATALSHHNDTVRVAVLEEGQRTVGFLAYEHHPGGVGRSLAYGLADCQALIGPAELTWDPNELLARCRLAVFEFDHLVAHQAERWAPRTLAYNPSPVIDLTGDWDTWRAGKKSRTRTVLQSSRKLARERGEIVFTFDSRAEQDLHQMMEWKGAQYIRTGRANRFGRPWFRNVVTELFHTRTEQFSLGVARLEAGGRTLAVDVSPRGNGTLAGWFAAYDPAMGSYSPGKLCLLEMIRVGREHGLTRIDLGRGDHEYKYLFADSEDQVAEGIVERPGGAAVLRRVLTAPRRVATDLVLSSPRLRVAARETLNYVGRVRSRLAA